MGTALSIILGGLITIVTAIFIEYLRRPRLDIRITPPVDRNYPDDRPVHRAKYLVVHVRNKPLPTWLRWMSRNAALQCHSEVRFHHLDGQDVFGRSLGPRWGSAPEPVPVQIVLGEQQGAFFDNDRFQRSQRADIYPGEDEELALAARMDADEDCWGWSNESYLHKWRNPDWRLKPGRYLVSVSVFSAGEHAKGVVRLINDVGINDCRLEPSSKADKKRISGANVPSVRA
jgi:hypothetical protein